MTHGSREFRSLTFWPETYLCQARNKVPAFAYPPTALYFRYMPSDEERFRFLDDFKLTANWDDEEFTLFWREKSVAWQCGRLYVISKGATLAEATDAAIERWERKHGERWSQMISKLQ